MYYILCCHVLRMFKELDPDEADARNNWNISAWVKEGICNDQEAIALRILSKFYRDELTSKEAGDHEN